MKHALILIGSPRAKGNTAEIARRIQVVLGTKGVESELIFLRDLNLNPCLGCDSCEDIGDCVQTDDMYMLWEKVESSDGLVLASPTYYSGVTAQMKTFIDRTGKAKVIWDYDRNLPAGSRFSKGKRAMLVGVSGQKGEKWLKCPLTEMRALLHDLEIPLYSIIKGHGADGRGGLFGEERDIGEEIRDSTERFLTGSNEIPLFSKK